MPRKRRFDMKKVMIAVLAITCVAGAIAIAHAIHEVIPSESQVVMPPPDAEKLSDYIIKYNPYRAWERWPGKGRLYKGTEPHGALLTTFVNQAASFSIKNKKGMAYDSIIVKENYTADRKLDALTVMYRTKGYSPEGGEWFWAKYAPDGRPLTSGKVEACITCHGKKKENDYIQTEDVKK